MLKKLAMRDLSIVVGTVAVWFVDGSVRASQASWLAVAVGLAAGLLAAVSAFLLHEWGHLAGAVLSRSVVHFSGRVASVFLFRFDSDRNRRSQFLAMSFGGLLASAFATAALLLLLPADTLAGRVAIVLVALGLIATFVLELPVVWQVARGAPVPRGAAYHSSGQAGAHST